MVRWETITLTSWKKNWRVVSEILEMWKLLTLEAVPGLTTPEKTEGIQSSSQKGVLQKFTAQFKLCKHEKKYQPVCGWERGGSEGSSEDFGEGGYRSSAEGGGVLLRQISLILIPNYWCPIVHAAWEAEEIELLTICCRAPIDTCRSKAGNFCLFVVFGGDPPTPHILIHPGCNPWSLLSALRLCVCNKEGDGAHTSYLSILVQHHII